MCEQHQTASLPQTKHVGNLNPKLGAPGVGEMWWFCPWAVFPCLQPWSLNSHSKLCTQAPRSSWRAGALCVAAVAVRLLHPLGAEFCSSSNLPVLHGLSYGSGSSHQPPRWVRKWGGKDVGLVGTAHECQGKLLCFTFCGSPCWLSPPLATNTPRGRWCSV